MDFDIKNQMPFQPSQTFMIQVVSSILGEQNLEDVSLCPV